MKKFLMMGLLGLIIVASHTLCAGVVYNWAEAGSGCVELAAVEGISGEESELKIPSWTEDGRKVISIGANVFAHCRYLTVVELPTNLVMIGEGAFRGANRLREISNFVALDDLEEIGESAFSDCVELRAVELPRNVKRLGAWAFCSCLGLEDVKLDAKLEEIGTGAFAYADAAKISVVEGGRFVKEDGILMTADAAEIVRCERGKAGDFVMGEDVKKVHPYAFYGCTNLTSVTAGSRVEEIGEWALSGSGAAIIDLANDLGLKKIGTHAFSGSVGVEKVEIPEAVEEIGDWAFYGMTELSAVDFAGSVPACEETSFEGVQAGAKGYYTAAHADEWACALDEGGVWHGLLMGELREMEVAVQGYEGVYDGQAHGITISVTNEGAKVWYASAASGPWGTDAIEVTDAAEVPRAVYYRVEAAGFAMVRGVTNITISARHVTLESASAEKVYDGTALTMNEVTRTGDELVGANDLTWKATGEIVKVGQVANTIEYEFAAGMNPTNYDVTVVEGTLKVTDDATGEDAWDGVTEPGNGRVPSGGISKYDVTVTQDGAGHTVDTNALCAAFVGVMGESAVVKFATSAEGPWEDAPIEISDVGTQTIWYKVESEKYVDYVHAVKLTITKRSSGGGGSGGGGSSGGGGGGSSSGGGGGGAVEPEEEEESGEETEDEVRPDYYLAPTNEVAALDVSAAQVYNGYLYLEDDLIPVGTIQVKASKKTYNQATGKTTSQMAVTIQMMGEKTKVSLSGEVDVELEVIDGTARDGRYLAFSLTKNGLTGTFDVYKIDGVRDLFSSKVKTEKTDVTTVVNKLKGLGAMTIAWQSEVGWNSLSLTVGAKGKTKVAGTLANGTKVSASMQMMVGEDWCAIPVMVKKTKVELAFTVWIRRTDWSVEVVGLGETAVAGRDVTLKEGAYFRVDSAALVELVGDETYAEYFPKDVPVTVKGKKWVLPKAGRVVLKKGVIDETKLLENPSGLKLTVRVKDGTFSGSFKVYVDNRGKLKSVTVSVAGVVVEGVGYGTASIKKVGTIPVTIE